MARVTKIAKSARGVTGAKRRGRVLSPVHDCETMHKGADHSAQISRLNRIVGQLQGVGRMIEANRYCPDILVQTRAIVSAVRSLESAILEDHLSHCVKQAFSAKDQHDAETMIKELVELYGARG